MRSISRLQLLLAGASTVCCQGQEVVSLWEGLSSLTFERSSVKWSELWEALPEIRSQMSLAQSPLDTTDIDDFSNGTNETNETNETNATGFSGAHHLASVLVSPLLLFVGQDVEQLIHVGNGLLVGGLNGVVTQLQSAEKIDPMMIVNVFSMLTAAGGSIAATLQNPSMGSIVQGGVIFKQASGMAVTSLYFPVFRDIAGCSSISEDVSSVYPHGIPEGCTRHVELPFGYGTIEGTDVANYLVTGFEYGLTAIGAAVAPALSLFMCILNAASLGSNMLTRGLIELIMAVVRWWGVPKENCKLIRQALHGHAVIIYTVLLVIGFLCQLKIRASRQKGPGEGPFFHVRFKALECRTPGNDPVWASMAGLRFRFHEQDVDVPDDYSDPPEKPDAEWLVTFDRPAKMTEFCFSTPADDSNSKMEADPVSWVLQASTQKDVPKDESGWVVIHQGNQESIPKARDARTDWFPLKTVVAGGSGLACCTSCFAGASKIRGKTSRGIAAVGAAESEVKSDVAGAAAAASKAETRMKGAVAGALDDAEAVESQVASQAQAAAGEAKAAAGKVVAEGQAALAEGQAAVAEADSLVRRVTSKISAVAVEAKEIPKKAMGKGKALVKSIIAPFMVINHVVKESNDKTAGKDPKKLTEIAMEALQTLGWEEVMYKFLMKRGLSVLTAKVQGVKTETINELVNFANDEELVSLAQQVASLNFGGFVQDIEDVFRKLVYEDPGLFEELKVVYEHLNPALIEYFTEQSTFVISKENTSDWLTARLMLMTIETISEPDGTVILKGHLDELDPAPTVESDETKTLLTFLEQMASGEPYVGRGRHIKQMQSWLEDDKAEIQKVFLSKAGVLGKIQLKVQPIIALYPKVKKLVARFKADPKKAAMKILTTIKDKIMKKVGRAAAKAEKEAKAEVGKVEKGVGKLEKGVEKQVGKVEKGVEKQVGKVEKGAEAAAQKAATEAQGAVNKVESDVNKAEAKAQKLGAEAQKVGAEAQKAAQDVDIEAQTATKEFSADASHGAPPSDLETPLLQDDSQAKAEDPSPEEEDPLELEKQRANYIRICQAEMNRKLGMTAEEAKRLVGVMSQEEVEINAMAGGVYLPMVLDKAAEFSITLNKEKIAQMRCQVDKAKLKKEMAKDVPASKRRAVEKEVEQMSPEDVAKFMSTPKNERPAEAPNMKKIWKQLNKAFKALEKENEELRKKLAEHDAEAAAAIGKMREDAAAAPKATSRRKSRGPAVRSRGLEVPNLATRGLEVPNLDIEQDPPADNCTCVTS